MSFFFRNKFFTIGLVLVVTGGALLLLSHLARNESERVTITDMAFTYELADTPQKREQGLSGRSPIPDHYGMLFVFEEKGRPGIWMKDMREPIDIIWLSDEGAILGIEHAVSPETYPDVFYPPQPVRYVLETRAGYASDAGWDVGTKIDLPQI